MQYKTSLDVHQIESINLGMYRSPFDKIIDLGGIQIEPADRSGYVWKFDHPGSGEKGRLLHMEGYLSERGVVISGRGMAYMITRQHYTLALAFASSPRRMWLTDSNHKILPREDVSFLPPEWPREMIKKVIRLHFRKIVIIDESFLLRQIGLRSPDSPQRL